MKKILMLIITLTLVFCMFSQVSALQLYYDGKLHSYTEKPIFLKVEGQDVPSKMPPIILGEFSLVPVREVFEAIGATVTWNDKLKTVTITYDNNAVVLKIGSNTAKVNGVDQHLVLAPKIINDKTMVPTRFVGEQLGLIVDWNDNERTIYISKKPNDVTVTEIKYVAFPQSSLIQTVSYNGVVKTKVVQIQISSDNPINQFDTMILSDPYRLVIDIDGAVLGVPQYNIPVSRNFISQVRNSQYSVDPNKTRVVIDFTKEMKTKAYLSSDKMKLIVDVAVPVASTTTDKDVVAIDPGHGGTDPGATYGGIYEKNLNLDIALRLKTLLEKEGVEVHMTRDDDSYVDLYARSDLANSLEADLLLSIHNNAMEDTSFDGTMTLYYPDEKVGFNNKRFAQIIQDQITSQLGTTDRGIIERPKLAVLRTSLVPSALVEVAFMTNKTDLTRLKNTIFIQNVAENLKDSIMIALKEKNS